MLFKMNLNQFTWTLGSEKLFKIHQEGNKCILIKIYVKLNDPNHLRYFKEFKTWGGFLNNNDLRGYPKNPMFKTILTLFIYTPLTKYRLRQKL